MKNPPSQLKRPDYFKLATGLLVFSTFLGGCAGGPSTLQPHVAPLAHKKMSPQALFVVELLPPEDIPVQQIHSWTVRVSDKSSLPLSNALVYVNGGMPDHGHGMPTRPLVTRELSPGHYLVEGMKFNMAGEWEILVAIQKGPLSDVTSFRIVIKE